MSVPQANGRGAATDRRRPIRARSCDGQQGTACQYGCCEPDKEGGGEGERWARRERPAASIHAARVHVDVCRLEIECWRRHRPRADPARRPSSSQHLGKPSFTAGNVKRALLVLDLLVALVVGVVSGSRSDAIWGHPASACCSPPERWSHHAMGRPGAGKHWGMGAGDGAGDGAWDASSQHHATSRSPRAAWSKVVEASKALGASRGGPCTVWPRPHARQYHARPQRALASISSWSPPHAVS